VGMMSESKHMRRALIPALFSVLAPVVAVGLAFAIPVEQVPGGTKCVWIMVVSTLNLGLGILGLVGAIRSSYPIGIVTAVLGVLFSLGTGLLGFIGFAWLWIDLKD
jgi:hypothetical protein